MHPANEEMCSIEIIDVINFHVPSQVPRDGHISPSISSYYGLPY